MYVCMYVCTYIIIMEFTFTKISYLTLYYYYIIDKRDYHIYRVNSLASAHVLLGCFFFIKKVNFIELFRLLLLVVVFFVYFVTSSSLSLLYHYHYHRHHHCN